MDVTDYNDGNWHGWNGGECPVHPKSEIDAKWITRDGCFAADDGRIALINNWKTPCLFRVTKPYVEPREFWIVETDGTTLTFQNEGLAKEYARDFGFYVIHVREVIEE